MKILKEIIRKFIKEIDQGGETMSNTIIIIEISILYILKITVIKNI